MSGDLTLIVGGLIALAVGVGIGRLLLRRPSDSALSPDRLAVLASLQVVAGVLMVLTLFPPSVFRPGGVLVVATEGAPAEVAPAAGEVIVALPEAGAIAGAARAPDLATALRRHPEAGAVRVIGHGLEPRDRDVTGWRLTFAPPPAPVGLTAFSPPAPVVPGAPFSVGGQVGAAPARVELLDPSGRVADRADIAAGGRFILSGQTRIEGLALFTLRLTAGGRTVDQIAVPVEARADAQPLVLTLAGAAGAETKYLRRWAEDAGPDMRLQVDLGAGAAVGDPGVALTRDALARVDLMIIDDRRWERLGTAQKAAISDAVLGGMGLLLRPEGPISPAVRREWSGLGLPLTGGGDAVPATVADPADPGETVALTRIDLQPDASGSTVLARDGSGVAVSAWRGRGRGRVGVWTLTDTYVLALSGRASQYGELWSAALSALSRPLPDARPALQAPAFAGSRMTLCGLGAGEVVVEAGARQTPLVIDAAAGARACAAYWPEAAGWRLVRDRAGVETPFYVHPRRSSNALDRTERRAATLALAQAPQLAIASGSHLGAGSPWPWFLALVATLAALWWLERNHPLQAVRLTRPRSR